MKKFFKTLWSVVWPLILYLAVAVFIECVHSIILVFGEYYATGTFDIADVLNKVTEQSLASTGVVNVIAAVICIIIITHDNKIHPEGKQYEYPKILLPSVIAAVGACLFGNMILSFSGILDDDAMFQMVNEVIINSELWLQILVAVVLGPLTEELLFRGIAYKRIERAYGFWPAAIVSSLLFGVFHGNLSQFIYAALLGMLFSYAYHKSGKMTVCITMHLIANAASLLLDGFALAFENPAVYYTVMTVIGAILLVIGLAIMVKSPEKQQKTPET